MSLEQIVAAVDAGNSTNMQQAADEFGTVSTTVNQTGMNMVLAADQVAGKGGKWSGPAAKAFVDEINKIIDRYVNRTVKVLANYPVAIGTAAKQLDAQQINI